MCDVLGWAIEQDKKKIHQMYNSYKGEIGRYRKQNNWVITLTSL